MPKLGPACSKLREWESRADTTVGANGREEWVAPEMERDEGWSSCKGREGIPAPARFGADG